MLYLSSMERNATVTFFYLVILGNFLFNNILVAQNYSLHKHVSVMLDEFMLCYITQG